MEHGNNAAGYLTDLTNLLAKYQKKTSLRYLDFVEVWQELEFWKVLNGRKIEHDRAEFIEEIYQITVRFLDDPLNGEYEPTVAVGALYTLYGLWYCQSMRKRSENDLKPRRIRISLQCWGGLNQFVQVMAKEDHTDFVAVYQRMITERVFTFSMYPTAYLLGNKWENTTEYDECSGIIYDEDLHSLDTVKELQRLYNRAVPVFDTYKRIQTKYLQNLTDLPHDPIEFSLKNPPADEINDCKIRIKNLTEKDVKMIEDRNTVLNRRQQIKEKSLNRKPHSTGLELAILPDPSPTNIRKYRNGLFGFNGYRNEDDEAPEIESNLEDDDSERSSPPRKRFKRGRPFVQGIEERINSGCRPGIFKVEKHNQDSGISSTSGSPHESDADDKKNSSVLDRIEEQFGKHLQPLESEQKRTERIERIEHEKQELEAQQEKLRLMKEKCETNKVPKSVRNKIDKKFNKIKQRVKDKENQLKEIEEREKRRQKQKENEMEGIKPRGRPKTKGRQNPEKTEAESASFDLKQEIVEDADDGMESDDDITLDQLQKQLHQTSKPKTTKSATCDQQNKTPKSSQTTSRKKEPSEPFKFNLESIEEVSIGDFYFIDPEELDQGSIPLTRPLLCKVMEIDTDLEIFTAEWWTMKYTGVGKTLYEYAWKKNDEMADTNQFCIEDVFEKVQFRKGLKLTKSQCGRVLEFYQMEDGNIIF